jgi:hypothetical protein
MVAEGVAVQEAKRRKGQPAWFLDGCGDEKTQNHSLHGAI